MAENDQNDEYKFDEYESYDHESMDDAGSGSSTSPQPPGKPPRGPTDVRRNALIAVGVIIAAMVGYKVVGGIFSGKSAQNKGSTLPPAPVATVVPQQQIQPTAQVQPQPTQQVQQEVAPQPMPQPTTQVTHEDNTALKQQVESIATNQQNVQSQVSSMNEQVGNVSTNINNLSAQINQLNQTITNLTNQLSKQSEEITILMQRTKPRPVRRLLPPQRYGQANIYYINAVIPGRAWLIGTNGSTLTVREGTKIAGYGVVKLIDSMEGRILTSSGRIIRFSQDDS
ncbi:type IVB secretion system protein IcmG/DotF [Legionella saoudiensis]|uniref:type IVB secretion system protein IcmG/DotF n=1 Tax=Legionella saoudiensis TaxID=1750561 RepID=UPI0007312D90|nr:type IVB secretion system protein IcmG/DotF [Legionella saoudiensis]